MSNEFMNRVGRPMQSSGQTGTVTPAPQSGGKKKKFSASKVLSVLLVGLVTIVLVLVIVMVAFSDNGKSISSQINKDKYQAVFLNSSDGQVYFGKLSIENKDYYKLTDIYYVRVQQVQPDKNATATQNISLAKLGSEIHGPEDVMHIRAEHVMFWENLKSDGQVVKAITEYKKSGSTSGNASSTTPGSTTPKNN